MTTHKCAAPDCSHQIPPHQLLCGHHWARVPIILQHNLYKHWNDGRPTAQYPAARAAVLAVFE